MKIITLILFSSLAISIVSGQRGGRSDGGRVVGGEDIKIYEAPYQASLLYYGYHICGGAIISKDYVITAAHCKLNMKSFLDWTDAKSFQALSVVKQNLCLFVLDQRRTTKKVTFMRFRRSRLILITIDSLLTLTLHCFNWRPKLSSMTSQSRKLRWCGMANVYRKKLQYVNFPQCYLCILLSFVSGFSNWMGWGLVRLPTYEKSMKTC